MLPTATCTPETPEWNVNLWPVMLQAVDDSLLQGVCACAHVCVSLLINQLSFIGCAEQIKDTKTP